MSTQTRRQRHTDPFANWQVMGYSHLMEVNGLKVGLNSPHAPESIGKGLDEVVQHLPPYEQRPAFMVDDYKCPPEWGKSTASEVCFFVPVFAEPPRHMWLDLNANFNHSHHVAVNFSIQGMNPITGQPIEGPALAQYRHKCPVHKVDFGADRFCSKCGYKWPPQNYLCTTGTQRGLLWLDGWRTEDGVVRGFLITVDESKGIAAQVLGDARTSTLKCGFFLSKDKKPEPMPVRRFQEPFKFETPDDSWHSGLLFSTGDFRSKSCTFGDTLRRSSEPRFEIGAGAKINQRIARDPEEIDFWRPEPECTIVINYVDARIAYEVVQAGKVDRTAEGEGPLHGLSTGNPPDGSLW